RSKAPTPRKSLRRRDSSACQELPSPPPARRVAHRAPVEVETARGWLIISTFNSGSRDETTAGRGEPFSRARSGRDSSNFKLLCSAARESFALPCSCRIRAYERRRATPSQRGACSLQGELN